MLEVVVQLVVSLLALIGLRVVITVVLDATESWRQDVRDAAAEFRLLRQVRGVNQSLAQVAAEAGLEFELAAQRMGAAVRSDQKATIGAGRGSCRP